VKPRLAGLKCLYRYLSGYVTNLVYEKKWDGRDELLRRILNTATLVKGNPKALMRATRSIRKCAKTCAESERGSWEYKLQIGN
jgi:hypothetical protein